MERAFIELLNCDAVTLEKYEENVCKAMAVLAEELPVSCVKVRLEVPVSKIYPLVRKHEAVLYGTIEELENNGYEKQYHLPDGGEVVFEIGICEGKELTEEQNDRIHYLFRETYVHYSRFMMNHMILQIINTDISTGVLTPEAFMAFVGELAENGIMTSIDDFGTGFSSLNMIKRVDIDVIKIDRSFIPLEQEYQQKKKDMIMYCSIVDLVKKLGKRIVAEGVETAEQLQYLTQAGCDIVQGYVFDKPLPQTEFEKRLCG